MRHVARQNQYLTVTIKLVVAEMGDFRREHEKGRPATFGSLNGGNEDDGVEAAILMISSP